MRNARLLVVSLAVAGAMFGIAAADDTGFTPVFGKDGGEFKIFPESAGTTFQVKEGTMIVSGKPAGYFYSTKSYKNYVLKYDWKYVRPSNLEDDAKFNGNSGCLVHIIGDHKIWPKSIEVQGMNKNHGQMLGVSGAPMKDAKFDAAARKTAVKPVGEWNTTEVTVQDGKITASINGTPVASCTTTLSEGPIAFQSEGAEIHFKNVMIKEAK